MSRNTKPSKRQVSLARIDAELDTDLRPLSDENRFDTAGDVTLLHSQSQSPDYTATVQPSVHLSVYSQLNALNSETRVVNLQAGSGEDPIVCEVNKVSLYRDDLRYQALSYVWGSSTLSQSIILNGKHHCVTDNLFATLHRLRDNKKNRTLWIDALCIDQSNVLERNAQVKMMRRIYSLAEECIIAIDQFSPTDLTLPRGDLLRLSQVTPTKKGYFRNDVETKLEDLSLDEIQEFLETCVDDDELLAVIILYLWSKAGSKLTELRMFLLPGAMNGRYHRAFSKLALWFSSPWWDRIWVVQETVLPVKVSVICGQYLVPWSILVEVAEAFHNGQSLMQGFGSNMAEIRASIMRNLYSKVLQLEAPRAIRSHGRDMGVLEVLWTYRHRQATDPRDHIYALCGLLPGHFAIAGITPDYTRGTGETFTRLAVALIKSTMSLDVLIGAGVRENSEDNLQIPSWTQNWIEPGEIDLHFGPYRYLAANMHRTALARPDFQGLVLSGNYSLEGSILGLVGLEMDTLEEVGGIMRRELVQSDPSQYKSLYQNWFQMSKSGRNTSNDESFWRTINYGLTIKKNGRTMGSRSLNQTFSHLQPRDTRPSDIGAEPQPGHPNFATVEMMTHRRRFFVTKGGKFGLGPSGILSGDKVYLLPSGRVPFILRPLQPGTMEISCTRTKELCFVLIGDCYLDGIMNGEAVKKIDDRDRKDIHLH